MIREFDDFREHVFDDDFVKSIIDYKDWTSHQNNHNNVDDVSLLDRMLSSKIKGNSIFSVSSDMDMYISDTIANKALEIIKWLYDDVSGLQRAFKLDFDVDDDGNPVGKGFYRDIITGTISEKTSNVVTIVLTKNNGSNYGFVLTTAYPDVTDITAIPTNRDISDLLVKTDEYQKANSVEKTYMELLTSPNPKGLRFKDGIDRYNGETYIHVEEPLSPKGSRRFNCYDISKDKIEMKTVQRYSGKPSELIYSDITNITKKMMKDGEKPKYKNDLLSGGNHAALKALHSETCAIIDTIFNRIREHESLPQLSKTKVNMKHQSLSSISEEQRDKQNQFE